jgi:transposase-like protein
MSRWAHPKIRSEDTWAEVRRAWEGGETAASVAERYDVGLDNVWRRRAKERWRRGPGMRGDCDPSPIPPEGWDRYADRKLEAFTAERDGARELALDLMRIMTGGPLESAPMWHMTFLYRWRADHLGAEVEALDRERGKDHPWAEVFWDADGRLRPLWVLDAAMLRLERERWRRQMGLPDGEAEGVP